MIYKSKYPLMFALILAAGMAGCIKEREVIPASGNGKPVIFSPHVSRGGESRALAEQPTGTRDLAENVTGHPDEIRTLTGTRAMPGHPVENVAGQTDAALIPDGKSFGVYAWVKETAVATVTNFAGLQNMAVTRDGSEYTYTPTADWPRDDDATLSFFAYYPYCDSADADESIAVSHGTGADQWIRVACTVSDDSGKHIDLMYAKTDMTAGYDPVNLNFGHALARLKFEGRTEGYPASAALKITGIKIKGATLEGELVVLDPTTQPGKPFWELSDAPADKGDMTVPAAHIKDVALTQTLQAVISTGGDMLVLPQSLGGLTVEVSASLNGTAFPQPFTFALDGTPNWTMNEITTYEITLTPDGMRVAARIADWTTDPVNVIQDGQWWLSVNEDEHRFPSTGGEFTLTAETNYNISTQGYSAGLQVVTEYVSGGSGWLTATYESGADGDLTREIKLTAPANSTGTRSAIITIQAGNLTKIINVKQIYAPPSYPAYPGVISYDPDTDKLTLDGTGVMVYFKFGGVVAMYSATYGDLWDTGDVAFNPSGVTITSDYTSVPYANGTTFPTHNTTNIAAGLGDPCMLVGLTLKEIKAGLKIDNTTWRLPIGDPFENLGTTSNVNVNSGGGNIFKYEWKTDAKYIYLGIMTLKEGAAQTTYEGTTLTLPAAGQRVPPTGWVFEQGAGGFFWSKTPTSSGTTGYYISINSLVLTHLYNTGQSSGFAIRCVRQ